LGFHSSRIRVLLSSAADFVAPGISGRRFSMTQVFREHGAAVGFRSGHAGTDGNPRSIFVVLALIATLIGTWVVLRITLG
jgi:hypothetical protein